VTVHTNVIVVSIRISITDLTGGGGNTDVWNERQTTSRHHFYIQTTMPKICTSGWQHFLSVGTAYSASQSMPAATDSAQSTWNYLPVHIHSVDKLSTFNHQLKSISTSLLSPSGHPVPAPQIRFTMLELYRFVYDDDDQERGCKKGPSSTQIERGCYGS